MHHSFSQLFDEGLTSPIEGQIQGNLQFILRVSDRIAYRMTGLAEKNVQLTLGGKYNTEQCEDFARIPSCFSKGINWLI